MFPAIIYSMKGIPKNLQVIESSSCILIDLPLILLITSCEIYSIPKGSKDTAVFCQ